MMLVDDGLEVLDEPDCWELVETQTIGRVGVTVGALPAIFPVNYATADRSIVFRTAPGTKFSAAVRHAVVAFQIDHFDEPTRTGWSVMLIGRADEVAPDDDAFETITTSVDPWVDGDRSHVVRITPSFVSGRRIAHHGRPTTV